MNFTCILLCILYHVIALHADFYVLCQKWRIKDVQSINQSCKLAGPVYTGMSLEHHWFTQCTLGYHWATQRIPAGYTGTQLEKSWKQPHTRRPLDKLSWNCSTLGWHWKNLVEIAPHWDATGKSNFCRLHWNTTGGTVSAHTHPGTYTKAE